MGEAADKAREYAERAEEIVLKSEGFKGKGTPPQVLGRANTYATLALYFQREAERAD